jgi:hypothetical protein
MQDYRNLIKKTGGFDEGMRLGLGYQEAMIANANNRAIVQKNQREEQLAIQKQQQTQQLSDKFSDPQFQGMSAQDQMTTLQPIVAKINPDIAVKNVQDQVNAEQATALQAQKDQQALKVEKAKSDMVFLEKLLGTFEKSKDTKGANAFLAKLKESGDFPILNNVDSFDFDGDEGYTTTIISDIPEKNKLGLPSGRYKITSETKKDGTQVVKKIESEEESLTLQDGTVNGKPEKVWVSKAGKIKGQNGEDLTGRFKPSLTSKEKNVITFGMPEPKPDKPSVDKVSFEKKLGTLGTDLQKDKELNDLRTSLNSIGKINALLEKAGANNTAATGAIFSIAKLYDSGKLSDQDINLWMRGADASTKAKVWRFLKKETTGSPVLAKDVKALKEVAEVNRMEMLSSYNSAVDRKENSFLIDAESYGRQDQIPRITKLHQNMKIGGKGSTQQKAGQTTDPNVKVIKRVNGKLVR